MFELFTNEKLANAMHCNLTPLTSHHVVLCFHHNASAYKFNNSAILEAKSNKLSTQKAMHVAELLMILQIFLTGFKAAKS